MMTNKYLFLTIGVICFLIGLFASSPILTGAFKALGGVFIIIYFILMLLKNQTIDENNRH